MINPNECIIRPFQPDDRTLVTAFFDQMGGESRGFFNIDDGNRFTALKEFSGPTPRERRFMAVDNGEMVGYVFLYEYQQITPWVGIAVAEHYKGKHLGRRLMAFVEQYAREHGKGGLFLTTHMANTRGQALYTYCGYQRIGVHTGGEILFFLPFLDENVPQ